MKRGLGVTFELPASLEAWTLMHISKKVLELTILPFDEAFPDAREARVGTPSCGIM
jgi:hypothetical protein